LQFVDIPQYHKIDTKVSEDFFAALSNSDDMRLFETTAVKKLIVFEWPLVLRYTLYKLFFPFVAYLIFYMLYMHFVFHIADVFKPFEYGVVGGLTVFAMYLLKNEIYQLSEAGLEYFASIWNYLDLVPPIGIIIFLLLDYGAGFFKITDSEGNTPDYIKEIEVSMQATMSLFVWLKFLYFLRIFESTGYLIRIII
jgi:hypothetical protein